MGRMHKSKSSLGSWLGSTFIQWLLIASHTMSYFPHIKAPATMSGNPLIEFLRHCVNNHWSIHPHGHLSMPEHRSREFRLWNYTIPIFPICLAAVEFGFSFKLAMNYSCDCANLDLCISSETLSNFCEKSVKNILLLNASYFLSEDLSL